MVKMGSDFWERLDWCLAEFGKKRLFFGGVPVWEKGMNFSRLCQSLAKIVTWFFGRTSRSRAGTVRGGPTASLC